MWVASPESTAKFQPCTHSAVKAMELAAASNPQLAAAGPLLAVFDGASFTLSWLWKNRMTRTTETTTTSIIKNAIPSA
jgi:hypothetical protein